MEHLKNYFANAFDFKGTISRRDYWLTQLFVIIPSLILNGLGGSYSLFAIISMLFSIAVFIPSLSISVRRMHDIGKSGWALLFVFLPFIGAFIVLYFLVQSSKHDNNPFVTNSIKTNRVSNHSFSMSPPNFRSQVPGNINLNQFQGNNIPHQKIVHDFNNQKELSNQLDHANQLMNAHKYRESIQMFMHIAKQYPDQKADCAGSIGNAFYFLRDYKSAVKYYMVAKKYGANPRMMDNNIKDAKQAYNEEVTF